MVSKTVTGFKEFLLRGNLVELAVAVIMGTTFGAVVTAFTAMLMDIIGKAGGVPDFSSTSVAGITCWPCPMPRSVPSGTSGRPRRCWDSPRKPSSSS